MSEKEWPVLVRSTLNAKGNDRAYWLSHPAEERFAALGPTIVNRLIRAGNPVGSKTLAQANAAQLAERIRTNIRSELGR